MILFAEVVFWGGLTNAILDCVNLFSRDKSPQHRLYFFPLPHEHGSFRPILNILSIPSVTAIINGLHYGSPCL